MTDGKMIVENIRRCCKVMRKFIIPLVVASCLMLPVVVVAQSGFEKIQAFINHDLKVELNGQSVQLKNKAINYKGSNYLPMREVAELLGVEVIWDEKTKTVKLKTEQSTEQTNDDSNSNTINKDSIFYNLNELNDKFNHKFSFGLNGIDLTLKYDGKEYKTDDTNYFLTNTAPYFEESFLLQFLKRDDLADLSQYKIDFKNKKVTKIKAGFYDTMTLTRTETILIKLNEKLYKTTAILNIMLGEDEKYYLGYYYSEYAINELLNIAYGNYKVSNTDNPFIDGTIQVSSPRPYYETETKYLDINNAYQITTFYNSDRTKKYVVSLYEKIGIAKNVNGINYISLEKFFADLGISYNIEFDKEKKVVTLTFN
jgi:hypothetical protein